MIPHIAPVYREEVGNLAEPRMITGFEAVLNKCWWVVCGKGVKGVGSGEIELVWIGSVNNE